MSATNIFEPKQKRSQDTQRKLLSALHLCLKNKFFEHISVKEIADNAGVSVGTFYRRFKDKESLLPLLYQDFGTDLANWVTELEQMQFDHLQQALETLATETHQFLVSRRSIFRTLHLNSRLHSALLTTDTQVDRKDIYRRLANIIVQFESEISVKSRQESAEVVVFMMITTLLDKVLYPSLTPAIASDLSAQDFAKELPKLALPYLQN
ncbi:TetR/AcrR family transcriptional regulator [Thalassotalea sp. PLHSN55]|uniref:TetR/AcrR family transcriptional regulator n=1 Tax=Thalassotalea sp. PLHSN55 TaxID=3435888 RepID=UPI003F82D8EA